jgi:hypothetical protein
MSYWILDHEAMLGEGKIMVKLFVFLFFIVAVYRGFRKNNSIVASDDNFHFHDGRTNPGSGLPMYGGLDAAGNTYGQGGSSDYHRLFD